MESDGHVVGPDATIANSKMVKPDSPPRGLEWAKFWFARHPPRRPIRGEVIVMTD